LLNLEDGDSTTPFILALKNKQTALVNYLLKQKSERKLVDLSICSKKYGIPLNIAIRNHDFQLVLDLLKYQEDAA